MGAFVNYFFSGFIMGKVPFPLSPSFRLMLQVRDAYCEECLLWHAAPPLTCAKYMFAHIQQLRD